MAAFSRRGIYPYCLDGDRELPDSASHLQALGVDTSRVVDHHRFAWQDHAWKGMVLAAMSIYELHTGAFTPTGILDAIIPGLNDLRPWD